MNAEANEVMGTDTKMVLIFGAKDHIGRVVAKHIEARAPQVKLRVATHHSANLQQLQEMFPKAEAVVANLLEPESLAAAVAGVDGIFQISPDVFNEDLLVENLSHAVRNAGTVKKIIRILGTPPGATLDMVPKEIAEFRHYPATQHMIARENYLAAGLPAIFLNVAGYYIDDFSRMFAPPILREKTIRIAYDKRLAWVDAGDVGEVAAEILLSNEDYVGRTLDLTGVDLLTFSEVAQLFTEVLGDEVRYDGNEQNFRDEIEELFSQLWGEQAPDYFMKYFKWETEHQERFHLTSWVKDILGREPKSFRTWLNENREFYINAWNN